MAPVMSLLRSMAEKGTSGRRPSTTGRAPRPTCSSSQSSSGSALRGSVPALSDEERWEGETGLVTDVVDRIEEDLEEVDAYLCGPPPMVDAAIALLEHRGCPSRASTSTSSRRPRTDREQEEDRAEGTTVTSERSVPKPVFTDAEAGAKEFPSSRSRWSHNYFDAAQAPRVGLRGRDRRRPARSRAPPDPGLGLRGSRTGRLRATRRSGPS